MAIRTGFVLMALLTGGALVAARADGIAKKPTKEAASAKPPGGGGGQYCCSSACCDLYAECKHDPKNCNGWHVCQQSNNNCSCTGKCTYPPNLARKTVAAATDPLVKAAASSSECQWECLAQVRSCLRKHCKSSESDCQNCTQQYTDCESTCGPPGDAA